MITISIVHMTILVIVESRAKCAKIESFLGNGFRCVASFGHIRDLNDGLKCIDVEDNFRPTFKFSKGKSKYIASLREHIRKADEVVLATDDDREGEAIAWHICDAFKLNVATTKRIIFHEITKSAIKHAIAHPTRVDMDKVHAQQARQVLDRLVGFIVSPLLWEHVSRTSKQSLSAGRCQTPALRIIYDNQSDIDRSPGKLVYETLGTFTKHKLPFKLNHFYDNEDKMLDFLETSANFDHIYSCSAIKKKLRKPPLPFTTSSLQQKASNELSLSPKRTMRLAQTLYEKGYITYMRTDSRTYSKEFVMEAKRYIEKRWGSGEESYVHPDIGSLAVAKGKTKSPNAQEAHEAIRPTDISRETLPPSLKGPEVRLYSLIWRNTVESCMSAAKYNLVTATLTAPEGHRYGYSAELITFPGWLVVGGYEEDNPIYHYLGQCEQGTIFPYHEIDSKFSMKDLKTHLTEARLVQQLEKKGIGRPSTFSSLVAKIQDRGYVNKENVEGKQIKGTDFRLQGDELEEIETSRTFGNERNKLIIQPTGIIVLEFLIKYMDALFQYDYTKEMEESLDTISRGEKEWYMLCAQCYGELTRLAGSIAPKHRSDIRIDDAHVYTIAKYGPVVKCKEAGKTTFKRVKKDLDIDKLRKGEYTLEEILDDRASFVGRVLGSYKNKDVVLKKGKYGLYISHSDKNYSIKFLRKPDKAITLEDVLDVLTGKRSTNPSVLLTITPEMSVRKGRYGPYIFYKTESMTKPRFLALKGTKWEEHSPQSLRSWIRNEYSV